MDKVSCIIPAYNEEERINTVLEVVKNHPLIDEVIVVNDGSKDKTIEVINKFKNVKNIRIIDKKKNEGKSKAMLSGVKKARNNILMFIDSDLIGLNKKNLSDLASPIIHGEADISLSLRTGGLNVYKYIGLDFITGERVFRKDIIDDYNDFAKLQGYGIESFMNKQIIKKKKKIKIVLWPNVRSPFKTEKDGFFKGLANEIKMNIQIIKTIGLFGIIYQIIKMSSLKV